MVEKTKSAYKLWQEYVKHFPKTSRYTLGSKIDELFIVSLEYMFAAQYFSGREKLVAVTRSITKLDLLKFFLQIGWEMKVLDDKKYIMLSEHLEEVGRMLGGWRRQLEQKTPTQ